MNFKEKYGEWAFIAGGSVGLGGAWSDRLAKEGMNVIVTGRNIGKVEAKRRQLEADFGVKTKGFAVDFGGLDALDKVKAETEGIEIGFHVYNAGISTIGAFQDRDIDYEMWRLNVNVRSNLALAIWFSGGMVTRRKGAIVLMSSCAGIVGSPYLQTYSASKAYILNLCEALNVELSEHGVDVLCCLAGATISQSLQVPEGTPGIQTGKECVDEAMEALGKVPAVITGECNRQMFTPIYDVEKRREISSYIKKEVWNPAVQDYFAHGHEENAIIEGSK